MRGNLTMSLMLDNCTVCPVECGADRTNIRGSCGADSTVEISSWNIHHGEEPPISGINGSGTIFFTHCSLRCSFCQNYPISHLSNGNVFSKEEFISAMLELQEAGVHNINFVTPTHYSAQIIEVLSEIKGKELTIPTVYNSSGYDKLDTLKEFEGLIDIYMPDAKYSRSSSANQYCKVDDYWEINRKALKEMFRQVGHLELDNKRIAKKGLLIRHLVLPGDIAGTPDVLEFIAENISKDTYISLMAQYHPAHTAVGEGTLGRCLTNEEYNKTVEYVKDLGFSNIHIQEL